MIVSLIAPEIMILWAFKQLQGALVIMKTVNGAIPPSPLDGATKNSGKSGLTFGKASFVSSLVVGNGLGDTEAVSQADKAKSTKNGPKGTHNCNFNCE